MSKSNAVITPANLELTPCRVTFKGVDLGATLGNVVVSASYKIAPIKADQFGESDIDASVSGQEFMITTELAEINKKENWKVAFPYADLVTSGPNKAVNFGNQLGRRAQDESGILLLHPLSKTDVDLSGDHKFFRAVATAESEIVFSPNEQMKLKVVWKAYPDTSTVPAKYYFHGDPAIGLIAASAAAPIYAGTGNGTMTGVTVFSGLTKTETITATLVTPAVNGGVFHVSGSLSGPLGLATVGIGFVSSVIAFTINDGAIDFVLNDQFTVATTAANYV